jgi:hypothetical protein
MERQRSPSRQEDPVSKVRLIWRRYKLGIEAPFAKKICRVFQFWIHTKPSNFSHNLPVVADLLGKITMARQIVQFPDGAPSRNETAND